jgi:hypothetical protein
MRQVFFLFGCLLLGYGCIKPKIEYDPQPKSQLAVECYLIPGKPFQLNLTETIPYLQVGDTPRVGGALVIISDSTHKDTLRQIRKGLYQNPRIVPPDYTGEYQLYVADTQGRVLTAKTTIQKPVIIDSVRFIFNSQNKAQVAVYFDDPPDMNYYTMFVLMSTNHWEYFDDNQFNGKNKPYQSGFDYSIGDKITIALTHLNKDAFDFTKSFQNAYASNNQPISEPGNLKSNVTGGIGIFTGFYPSVQNITVYR